MLNDKEKNELIARVMQSASCPATINGELAAFRHGVVVAINAIGGAVSVDGEEVSSEKEEVRKGKGKVD